MPFSILEDQERVYRVAPARLESEVRKRFNPGLASGISFRVGGRCFEIDGESSSAWSPFRWGSSKGAGLIQWGVGNDKDKWKSIK